jgi:hypothetical protein
MPWCSSLLLACASKAKEVKGSPIANGKPAAFMYAIAQEVDSATEKGCMDVIVALSDRNLGSIDARNLEPLEAYRAMRASPLS